MIEHQINHIKNNYIQKHPEIFFKEIITSFFMNNKENFHFLLLFIKFYNA